MIETPYGRIFLHENGIVYFTMQDNLSIDMADAQQMVADVRSLDGFGQIRLIVDYGVNSDLTFKAQRYFASVTGFTHLAFITHTRVQTEIGQFLSTMLRFLKSSYEFRVFSDLAQAEAWLLQS